MLYIDYGTSDGLSFSFPLRAFSIAVVKSQRFSVSAALRVDSVESLRFVVATSNATFNDAMVCAGPFNASINETAT